VSWWQRLSSSSSTDEVRPYARRRGTNVKVDKFGEPARGPARPDVVEIAFRLGWRYRHQLAPFYVALGLAMLASIGHDYAPPWWPLVLPAGGAVTAAVWHWRADRRPVEVYVLTVGSVATVWTAVAWWASPWHNWLMWTAVLGAVAGGIPRWWHYRWRAKVVVKRGAPRGTRRRLRQIMKRWPELAEDMELGGSQVRRAEADETGITFTLTLRPGLTAADVVAKLSRVESVLETRTGGVRVLPDPDRANVAILRVVRRDPLAAVIPWPGSTATSINEPLTLGLFDNGEPVRLVLIGEHVLIGGTMGRGKSGLLNAVMAGLSLCPDVVVWGIDMKLGLELMPWLPVLGRLATTNEEALALLTAANRVLDARARLLARRMGRKWRPSAGEPALVVAIDELAELSGKVLALFERLARMGRAAGIVLVAVTQRPSLAALGSLDARTQMTIRVSMGVIEARDAELILGTGRLAEGWRTERLGGPGYFLVLAPGQQETPRQARAYWLSDAAVRAAADRVAATRPTLDPASAEAAAGAQKPAESADRDQADGADDPDGLLMAALEDAPQDGLSADELAARLGRSRTWVYKRLVAHRSAGRAVRLRRGRWAADRAGKPRAQ
jgi:DNA segregation ATPase FtsK/SpoIIIE, S-DNA-T family